MIRSILSAGSIFVFTALVACSSNDNSGTSSDKAVTTLDISPTICGVAHASSLQMHAQATYADNTSADVTSDVAWSVSSDNATITSSGNLEGANLGSVTVTATLNGKTASVTCLVS